MAGRSGAIRAGRAFVELFADNNPLARDLREGAAMLRRFAGTARAIGQSLIGGGLKIGLPFALATAVFVGFEDQMAEVRAVTQATAKDFATMTKEAERLGRTTSFTAKEVAGAQTELGRAGFNPSQITASTASILALARGTKTELAQAAQIGADSLRAFRMEAALMPRVADTLVATANNSSQGLIDLFEALKTVGPVAADVGANISDTAAAIGVLANNGIKGTLAGNALKRAYLNLANPAIQKKIEDLTGVSAVDTAGNLRPLASVITDIGKATASLPNAKRLDIFSQIFGDRAVVAASAFAGSAANFTDLQSVLDGAAGTAERTAQMMDDTLGGSFRKLSSAVEGIAIAVGRTLSPAVRSIADSLATAAGHVTAFVNDNQGLILALAGLSAAAIAAGASLLVIGGAASVLAVGLSGLSSVAGAALGFLPALFRSVTSPARLATAAVLGLAAATAGVVPAAAATAPAVARPAVAESTDATRAVDVADDVNESRPARVATEPERPEPVAVSVPVVADAQPEGETTEPTTEPLESPIQNISTAATSAAAAVLPLAGSFAGLRVSQGILGGVVAGLRSVPKASKTVSTAMIANSTAARRMTAAVGVTGRVVAGTFAGAVKVAHGPVRALSAATLTTAGHLTKTGAILAGNVAGGFDAAATALSGASRKLSSAGRGVVLASTALTRTAGRASLAVIGLGRASRIGAVGVLSLSRSITRTAAVSLVGGLKAITQTIGGLTISAFRASVRLFVLATSITTANVAAATAAGFRTAAGGMRLLSMGALNAAAGLKKAGKAIRSTMALARVGSIATAAAAAISGAVGGLVTLATSPVALFAALAAGAVAAILYAAGSVDVLRGVLSSLTGAAGSVFRQLATQAGTAWRAISETGGRAFGAIVQLVKRGDLQAAFKVATAALALMWAEIVASFVDTWAPVKIALVNGWRATAQLFGAIFGGAVSFVRDTFASFASWFSSGSGAGSMPTTVADAVAEIAELFATGWMVVKSMAADAVDVMADGWETFTARITNAWSTAIGFIQKGWTRLKGLIDSDIDVEAEVKEIDKVNAAGNEARNNERDQRINQRAADREAAKKQATEELTGQLAEIEADRIQKNAESSAAIAAERDAAQTRAEARRKAFEEAMQAANPVDAVADTGKPTAATVKPQPGTDPVTGKTPGQLFVEYRQAVDDRARFKEELSGANRNGRVNPKTGRTKEEIERDYMAAGERVNDTADGIERAADNTPQESTKPFGLPSATAAEQRKAGKSLAEAFSKEAKPFERDENGQLLDPDSGRPISEILADGRDETTRTQAEKVAGSGDALARTESRLAGSLGSFSARAAAQSGAGSVVMNRIADATKATAEAAAKTAENTEKMAEGIDDLNGLEAE